MRPLSAQIEAARRLMHTDQAWIWLVEIESVESGKHFRLAGVGTHVTAASKVWQACSLRIEPPSESDDGAIGEASVTVPNVSRLPLAFVEEGDLLGQPIRIYLAHESHLSTLTGVVSWETRILRARIDAKAAIFECGSPAEVEQIPSRVMDRRAFPQLLSTGARRLG